MARILQQLRARNVISYYTRSEDRPMPTVEVRIAPGDVTKRMDEIRRWLDARGIPRKLASTGSSNEIVVYVEFMTSGDAEDFAREFAGTVVAG